jgi:hypothetical protein
MCARACLRACDCLKGILKDDQVGDACRCALASRVLEEGETELRPEEQALLDRICEAYYLPPWCSIADYECLFEQEGLKVGSSQA